MAENQIQEELAAQNMTPFEAAAQGVNQYLEHREPESQEGAEPLPEESSETETAQESLDEGQDVLAEDEELFELPHRKLGAIKVDREQLLKYAMIGADRGRRDEELKVREAALEEELGSYEGARELLAYLSDPANAYKAQQISAIIRGDFQPTAVPPNGYPPSTQPAPQAPPVAQNDYDAALDQMLEEDLGAPGATAAAAQATPAPTQATQPAQQGQQLLLQSVAQLAQVVQGMRNEMDQEKKVQHQRAVAQAKEVLESQVKSAIENSSTLSQLPAATVRREILWLMQEGTLDLRNAVRQVELQFGAIKDQGRKELVAKREEDQQRFVSESPGGGVPKTTEAYQPQKDDLRMGRTLQAVMSRIRGMRKATPGL